MDEAYLDNNATTMLLPEVREAIVGGLERWSGNPSSKHRPGTASRRMIEEGRGTIAEFFGAANPSEILFTSSATESITQAFQSGCLAARQIVVCSTDHTAVLDAAARWEAIGVSCIRLPVNRTGELELDGLTGDILRPKTFVSFTLVNNETGIIPELALLRALCRQHDALLHIDAAQAAGRVPIDVEKLECDYMSLSPHKFHGPKGVGILYARHNAPRANLIIGHQEFCLRGGTENVIGIAGAVAAVKALRGWPNDLPRIAALRDRLEQGILAEIHGAAINGSGAKRAANTSNIFLPRRDAAEVVDGLNRYGVYVSAGAACSTGGEPSHVIRAMGFGAERANSSIRFSLSKLTTSREIDLAIQAVVKVYKTTLALAG